MTVYGSVSKIQYDVCFNIGFNQSRKFKGMRCKLNPRKRSSSNCDYVFFNIRLSYITSKTLI